MKRIDIQAVPNQSFSARLENSRYDFVIKETAGVMSMTISRDNIKLLDNVRITSGAPIIPYIYLEQGNFAIVNENEDLIYYDKFGVSQFLVYASTAELLELRA